MSVLSQRFPERLPLRDAEVYFLSELFLGEPAETLLRRLIEQIAWTAGSVTLWGKRHAQPRLTAWHGDPGATYAYSGQSLQPRAWTGDLLRIKQRVEAVAEENFNSVLLNYYRDHRDSIGMHSDDEAELGPRPVIASLSLGAERTFILRHRSDSKVEPVRLKLASGCLLLMKGTTQRHWKHGIAKQTRPCGPRLNLTFRRIRTGGKALLQDR